jgi:lipoxygenase
MAAANYRDTWTFESQGLPNDLVARGMAVRDESAPHGVKLVVEDYPYAADGLELWSTIKGFNREYVDVYYKDDDAVLADPELQAWWKEMREKAHEDKKDAPGWPELTSKESLVEVLTTIQWIPSCQHAAVNFGQYDYAGWMPHHPTMTRRLIPEEGTADWDTMVKNPEKYYLLTISNIDSTTAAMSVYEVLSAHSPNEEYIGQRQKNWTADEQVCILQAISNRFSSLSLM